MVQIYIKYKDDNFYLLDNEDDESVNLKITVKDLSDITKIFAPFSQAFKIPATDKNKILCGFIGNEKIQRINNEGKFDALLYVSGFLYQSGKLTFDDSDYNFKEQKSLKANFASNLTGLKDKLGDMTIQDLFKDNTGAYASVFTIQWNKVFLQNSMSSIIPITSPLTNTVLRYGIPFVSNKRVWGFDPTDLSKVDNIAYKQDSPNAVLLEEVRPAITYMTIMEHLLLKIGVPITCPIFEKPEVKDLFVYCNSEKLIQPNDKGMPLVLWNPITSTKSGNVPNSVVPKWTVSQPDSNTFKIKRNVTTQPNRFGDGFNISLKFNNLTPFNGTTTGMKVSLINMVSGITLDTKNIPGDTYDFRITDSVNGATMLDSNGELLFKFEILPTEFCTWTDIRMSVKLFSTINLANPNVPGAAGTYTFNCVNAGDHFAYGGRDINLISTLPKMKAMDFLKSFFKMFNISVISTGLDDQSMYWVTPENIAEPNKPYSKRIVDYTQFTAIDAVTKKRGNEYNQYVFKHKDSKYYDAVYGDGSNFGELKYPTVTPKQATKFEITTDYSILKQNYSFFNPSGLRTCLAFTKDTPTTLPNGSNRYKSVYEEFTLMYLKPVDITANPISLEWTPGYNWKLNRVLESSFKNPTNGKTLGFGGDGIDTNSLYLNYYRSFIELLLLPNTYKSEFECDLPPNEIFLNFSNQTQGESNIPTGFRPQNEIIIGEQRYFLLDATINTNNGKTKLTLLNF